MNINATMIGQAITFVLFVWFCMRFVWPPIIKAIEQRQKDIAQGWTSYQSAKKELELTKDKMATLIGDAKLEASTIIEKANKHKLEILQEAKQQAMVEKERIIAEGLTKIEVERKRLKNELTKQLATLVIAGAEKIVERSVDRAVSKDITDQFVAKL